MKLRVYSAGPRRRAELFPSCGLISAEKVKAVERDREEVGAAAVENGSLSEMGPGWPGGLG